MSFVSTIIHKTTWGDRKVHIGKWTGASVSTGEVSHGLSVLESLQCQSVTSGVTGTSAAVQELFPLAGTAATITFYDGSSGTWVAIGR